MVQCSVKLCITSAIELNIANVVVQCKALYTKCNKASHCNWYTLSLYSVKIGITSIYIYICSTLQTEHCCITLQCKALQRGAIKLKSLQYEALQGEVQQKQIQYSVFTSEQKAESRSSYVGWYLHCTLCSYVGWQVQHCTLQPNTLKLTLTGIPLAYYISWSK